MDVIEYDHTYRLQWGWQKSSTPQEQVDNIMESFFDLLPTMDPWEWQLLFDVEFLCEEEALWEALTTQSCTIASDGSASNGNGSFAWVISGGNGDILAECKGPVPGAKVTSFRAKGYGILLVLQFLLSMSKVHGGPADGETLQNLQAEQFRLGTLQERVQRHQKNAHGDGDHSDRSQGRIRQHYMVCDNQSMVNKTNEISKFITMYPNSTMASEYDAVAKIRNAMRALGASQPEIAHIKGHQNEKNLGMS